HRADLDTAQAWFETVIRQRPTYTRSYFGLSQLLSIKKMPEQALAVAERGLQWEHADVEGWLAKGRALSKLGRHAEAIACYENYLARRPADPEALRNYGNALSVVGKLNEAERQYVKLVDIDPADGEAHYALGRTRLKLSGEAAAIPSFAAALRCK